MSNFENFFQRAPLEVEYRVKGNQQARVEEALGQKIIIPRGIYITDNYLYFHRPTGDLRRVRRASRFSCDNPHDLSEPFYQEQWKFHPFGEYPVELKKPITQADFSRLCELGQQDGSKITTVSAERMEIWIPENGVVSTEKIEGALYVTFDKPEGLGDWTEFEVEIYDFGSMERENRKEMEERAKRRILGFIGRLGFGIQDLQNPTYVEMVLGKE